jgi:hypothetical protein
MANVGEDARSREVGRTGSRMLDALDPALAAGVSHHEPGGLSVGDVLRGVAVKLITELAARRLRD